MANNGTGFGFQAFGPQEGQAPSMGQVEYKVRSSNTEAIFTGDAVIQSSADPPFVTRQTAGSSDAKVLGIFTGCKYYNPTASQLMWNNYFPGSVATSCGTGDVVISVVDDPQTFWIARSGSLPIASSHIGMNVGTLSSYGGISATGQSLVRLSAGTISQSASLPYRIVDLYSNHCPPGWDGSDNTTGGNIVVVRPNNWVRNNLTAITT